MSLLKENPHAFPTVDYVRPEGAGASVMEVKGGMTLRDYFAAKALTGMLSEGYVPTKIKTWNFDGENHHIYAEHAYKMADAMLKEREK